jgi:hypothetical protein
MEIDIGFYVSQWNLISYLESDLGICLAVEYGRFP